MLDSGRWNCVENEVGELQHIENGYVNMMALYCLAQAIPETFLERLQASEAKLRDAQVAETTARPALWSADCLLNTAQVL
ncbi:MAG: hypothetical protein WBE76_27135 [Terracidiphilus sp.]